MNVADLLAALPQAIRVGPYDFAVGLLPEGDENYGLFSPNEMTIRVRPDVPSVVHVIDTVLHEIMHAIFWAYLLREADDEERTVGTLATGWTQVYRDNPGLVRWLAEVVS